MRTPLSFLSLCACAMACSGSPSPSPAADAATPTDAALALHDASAAVPDGGHIVGMVTVNGHTGVGISTDGDNDVECLDLDGDPECEGEDLDGDGTITVWDDLDTGTVSGGLRSAMPSTDPDLFAALDPANPPNNLGRDGQVMEPGRVVNDMPAGLLLPRMQGAQGACAAFAVAAAATLTRRRYELASMPMATPMLNADTYWASPAWLYTRMIAARMGTCDNGTQVNAGLDLLVTTGAATWAEEPFLGADMPTVCARVDAPTALEPHRYRIGGYTGVMETGLALRARVRESLAAGNPVLMGAQLPDGFIQYRPGHADLSVPFRGTGRCTGSRHCSGHAMLITGYDDTRGAYRVLNSWGTDWGDRGYMWWDYAALEGALDLEIHVITPFPSAPTPLAAPNAAGFTMRQPEGSRVALVRQVLEAGRAAEWSLVMRVTFSEPIMVQNLRTTFPDGPVDYSVVSGMNYGDLVFLVDADPPPAPGTMTTLTVSGQLRDGTRIERSVTLPMPAPTTVN
jgi:Papain family cysteine protease